MPRRGSRGKRALDVRIAREVLGREVVGGREPWLLRGCVCRGRRALPRRWGGHWYACVEPLPRYAADGAAALALLEALRRREPGARWGLVSDGAGWALERRRDAGAEVLARADTPARAVAEGALAAAGGGAKPDDARPTPARRRRPRGAGARPGAPARPAA